VSDPGKLFPTVTDANLVLGRIQAQNFLGGQMPLKPDRAEHIIRELGEKISLSSIETALGIIAVVNTHMERLLRLISVERGNDPRDFTMLSFGGAGGLHAVDLARKLAIPQVLVPPYASTLSALGMLAADLVKDYSKTVMLPGDTPIDDLDSLFEPLVARARQDLMAEGIS
jgi:N-methylhydantoinase A